MKIGDKVVCVDDSPSKCHCCLGTPSGLILNNVYVVSGYSRDPGGILLLGFPAPHHDIGKGFRIERFRLLDELKQQAAVKQSASQPMLANEKGK